MSLTRAIAGEYHAVNQIVGKSLHTTDDDCFEFTKTLIERLEATKAERADDDAIVDNDAGQAYVEQFAHETFRRAERTLCANKVTRYARKRLLCLLTLTPCAIRQTADTFDAAATFFDLIREWGPLDSEILQKIKFAKWNAARILKAIREGIDPNESNPQPAAQELETPLSLDDPSVRQLLSPEPPQPVVEDGPGTGDAATQPPLASQPPLQEGYFPPEPPAPGDVTAGDQRTAPGASAPPPSSAPFSPTASPASFLGAPAPAQPPHQVPSKTAPHHVPSSSEVTGPRISAEEAWSRKQAVAAPVAPPTPLGAAPAAAPLAMTPSPSGVNHRDINQAQKHAKWAISALNFEDVPTAVKELRNALAVLGAQ